MSALVGEGDSDPWNAAPAQPAEAEAYERQRLALSLMLLLPGMPVLYYGDEVGLAGAEDPDSRRVMPETSQLSVQQRSLLEDVRRLGTLRRCSPALRSAERETLHASPDLLAFTRGDGAALAVVSRDSSERTLALAGDSLQPGTWVDALGGDTVEVGPQGLTVTMAPRTTRLFLPQGDACVE
jgi:glycosidase